MNFRMAPNNPPDEVARLADEENEPPRMSAWNGCIRFGLEVAAVVGIAHFGYVIGPSKWSKVILAIVMSLAAVISWVAFNVPNDPSRGGSAPIPVRGVTRLGVELAILGFGGYTLGVWNPVVGVIYGGLGILHYVSYRSRIWWLLYQN